MPHHKSLSFCCLLSHRPGGSRQNSPNGVDVNSGLRQENDFLESQALGQQSFQLDPSQFGQMAIDPISFDYSSQVIPSVDSPNFNMDYSQVNNWTALYYVVAAAVIYVLTDFLIFLMYFF